MHNLKKYFKFDELVKLDPYDRALLIVQVMFNSAQDKEGAPYMNHLLNVSGKLETEEEKIVGLLHDLVEDTDATFEEVKEAGFSDGVINALRLVTKQKGEDYPSFIDRIINSNNKTALKVKLSDMQDNMDPDRMSRLPAEVRERLQKKYEPQYQRIVTKIGELKW